MNNIDTIRTALAFVPANSRELWLRIGMAIKSELGEEGFNLWNEWSQQDISYDSQAAKNVWKSIKPTGGINIGTLFYEAKKYGYKIEAKAQNILASVTNRAKSELKLSEDGRNRQRKADEAANRAKLIWENAQADVVHNYLESKGVLSHGTSVQSAHAKECRGLFWTTSEEGKLEELIGNLLLIPLYNIALELRGLQAIDERGRKSFQRGIVKKGLFMQLLGGNIISPEYNDKLYIAEGFATAATIREATNKPTIMAIDASNLRHVSLAWRTRCLHAQIIIAGDNDKSGTGQKAAKEAARLIEGSVVLPEFILEESQLEKPPSDFNDLYQLHGTEQVKKDLGNECTVRSDEIQDMSNTTLNPSGVQLIRCSDLKPESIQWFWENWLAAGKLHIIAGAPGTGKTTIALSIAAIVSKGGLWPDGTQCAPGNVLIWSGEDDPKDTLLPRLLAQGADPEKICIIGDFCENKGSRRPFDPAQDMPSLLEKAIEVGGVKLIIVDPVVSAVAGDSHKNSEVRRALQPLVDLGQKLQAVILGISHFSKGTIGRNPLERVTGSLAFGAIARIVLATNKTIDESGQIRHLLARIKSNIGPDEGGFYYEIEGTELIEHQGVFTSRVIWGDFIEGTAQELLANTNDLIASDESSLLGEAKNFLETILIDGAMAANEIKKAATDSGLTNATLRRAKIALKIKSFRDGYGKSGIWKWLLPPKVINEIKDVHKIT